MPLLMSGEEWLASHECSSEVSMNAQSGYLTDNKKNAQVYLPSVTNFTDI